MRFQTKHADFGARVTFVLVLSGLVLISFVAGGIDFRGYYAAAELVTRGGNPYDYSQLAPVLSEITGSAGNNPYFYPPWFCLFFIPLTVLPFEVARLVWLVLNAGLFYISLRVIQNVLDWDIEGWRKWAVYLAATLLFAAYCLRSEQLGIALLFFAGCALMAIKREQYALAGIALVLLASKPQATIGTVMLIALWMLAKQRRSLVWAVGWTLVLTIVSTLAIPNWWMFDRTNFGAGLAYELDGPDQVAAVRLLSTVYDFSSPVLSISEPFQYVLAFVVTLFGIGVLWLAWRHTPDLATPVSAAIILTLLVTPYALQYDYVPLALPFFWILVHLSELNLRYRWVIVVLLAFSFSILVWQRWSYQGYLQLLAIAAAFAITLYGLKTEPTFQSTIDRDGVLEV